MAGQTDCSWEDIVPECKLPGDVMVSILSNLPVKSLLKFKAVSKPWCSLISSPRFINLHLHRQSVIANNLLMRLKDDSEEDKFGILNPTHNYNTKIPADEDVFILEISPLLSPKHKHLGIVGTCNGLVCLYSFVAGSEGFILWNPATRKYRSIEFPNGDYELTFRTLGLCYVDAANDFKILGWNDSHPPSPVDRSYLFVYSLSSDSWEKLDYHDAEKIDIDFEQPTFMGRCMHWLSHTCPNGFECTCSSASEIVAFDVTDGAMSCFHLPVNCGGHSKTLKRTLAIRGCLSVVVLHDPGSDFEVMEKGFEVWVMEEYGVEESWVKRFFIQGYSRYDIQGFTQVRLPLISWNYGEIVFNTENDAWKVVIFYDPYSKKKNYVEFKSFKVLNVFNYVESFASVGIPKCGELFTRC